MDAHERKCKRRKTLKDRKFLLGEEVEVLSHEEEFIDSWHEGVVIGYGECSLLIRYSHLLNDDNCSRLEESINVSDAFEGLSVSTANNQRGRIRPLPPRCDTELSEIRYGLCMDALVEDAWWEGVVFDHEEGSTERLVFFPGLGDQQMITVDRLRLTQDWDEVSRHWKPRGTWLLLEVLDAFEQEDPLPVSIREIWYDLRATNAFMEKIEVWTSRSRLVWNSLVSDLIRGLLLVANGQPVAAVAPHNQIPDAPSASDNFDMVWLDFPRLEEWKEVEEKGDIPYIVSCDSNNGDDEAEFVPVEEKGKPWKTIDLEAKYCPKALETSKHRGEMLRLDDFNQIKVKKNVRSYLLDLGWRIESKTDAIRRYRYISPEGKIYYSLNKVCCHLKSISCPTSRKESLVPEETSMNGHLAPETLPNIIREYEDYMKLVNLKEEREFLNVDVKLLRSNAKKHLVSMGWRLWMKDKKNSQELRYTSPSGRTYISLSRACKAYLKTEYLKNTREKSTNAKFEDSIEKNVHRRKDLHCRLGRPSNERESGESQEAADILHVGAESGYITPSNLSEFSEFGVGRSHSRGVRKLNKRSNNMLLSISVSHDKLPRHLSGEPSNHQQCKKRKASQDPVWRVDGSRDRFSTHELRSSKRSQQAVALSPVQNIARTVLNWLIDSDVILPREKVFCCHRRDGRAVKEGRVTRAGIKCNCCNQVFNLSNFEAHAGRSTRRPAAHIFLQDGKSLLECQVQMLHANKPKESPHMRVKSNGSHYLSDDICSVCQDGGLLMLCDLCPSAFHPECVGLEDAPEGEWFCPSCRCAICGSSEFNLDTEQFTEKTVMYCDQCEREYHVGCLGKRCSSLISCPIGNWFCSTKCSKIFFRLRDLLGKSNPTSGKGLSWTLLRTSRENGADLEKFDVETMSEYHSRLCVALDVLHECFVTVTEHRTRSDLVADLLFNKESELNRLNFWGFYTMLLEEGDELISVATFRVYGEKVAEMPFIGTRVQYRRQGMCRLLMGQLEKLLSGLGVERLLLPAVPQLLHTWTTSFGFTPMTSSDRLGLSEYTFLTFQDTILCQKVLREAKTVLQEPRANQNGSADRSSITTEGIVSHNYRIGTGAVEVVEPSGAPPSLGVVAYSLPGEFDSGKGIRCQTDAARSLSVGF